MRKQHMSSEEQVRQFENSVPFKLTTQYCAPRRPAPPARSSSRLVSPCSLDHWNSDSYSVQLTSLLPAPESYTDNVCDTLHSPAIRSSSSSVDDLPPIPPPPVPPRGGRSSASAFSRYHEKPVQTSLEDISGDLSGSDDNDGPQSLTYRSAISRSNGHTRTAVPSHGKCVMKTKEQRNSLLIDFYFISTLTQVYYDADLISDTYGEVDSLDTADLSLLSCLSQLPDSLNQTMTGSVDNRVGSVTVEPLLQVRPRRKRRLVPLPLHDDEHIIHVHRSQASNDATDLETKDDEDEDDTDEIIGIAASLQREIKLLLERRKEQMVQDSSDQEE